MMIEDFPSRLHLALHGIPVPAIESSILGTIRELVREELRALQVVGGDAPDFDTAAEELRALRRMLLRRTTAAALRAIEENRLIEIERIKREKGLVATEAPDVSRATALRLEAAAVRSPGGGIEIRDLWRDGDRRALHVTMPPGSRWPSLDYHIPGPEEVYVISGDLNDGPVTHTAGAFIHYPAGSSHAPSTRDGCALFVFYPEG